MTTQYEDAVELLRRARRTADPGLLDLTVERLRSIAERQSEADPDPFVQVLSTLGVALSTRYAWRGRRDDLDESVSVARRAAALRPAHPDRPALLTNLADVLRARYEAAGDPADLDEAIDLGREAAGITTAALAHLLVVYNNLATSLRVRFQATGERADIDEAVDICGQAVALMPDGYPNADALLANLAAACQTRSERTGDSRDLDRAIMLGRRAAQAGRPGSPHRPSVLSNLGAALQVRFERTGDGHDLDEAIQAGQASIDATPDGHTDLTPRLASLAAAHLTRFERSDDPADIDRAVELIRRAISLAPPGDPSLPGRLSKLAVALRIRFEKAGGSADDLREAVEAGERAINKVPSGHPARPGFLSNLGTALRTRFGFTGELADAGRASSVLREAVEAMPAEHPDRALLLSNLGAVLYERHEAHPDDDELPGQAVEAFRQATGLVTARPRVRAATGAAWGRVSADQGDWAEAERGLAQAVGLLGLIAARELEPDDQMLELARHAALASDAAACALNAGSPDRALALLEQGRGVLLGQALETRGTLDGLAAVDPGLAARFDSLIRDLDIAPARGLADVTPEAVEPRRRLVEAFEAILDEIRAVPGFAGFLRPPDVRDLQRLAEAGPVVVVNVSTFRSDALVVRSDGVQAVPLPLVGPEEVRGQVLALPDLPGNGEKQVEELLDWLWQAIAAPVLAALDLTGDAAENRLWWIPTGMLALLPLHAAQSASSGDGLLDRAICSYVPTLRALAHSRRPATAGRSRTVVIGPGPMTGPPLPASTRETAFLRGLLGEQVELLADPTRSGVLDALEIAPWAHFACHAQSDPVLPSRSALLVHDADGGLLTVPDLFRLRLTGAELAYLSACATARTSPTLSDEVLHITSAFQLAGYRHVIGTLWPIPDSLAYRVARGFYTALVGGSTAPEALHTAACRIRDRLPDSPSVWAAHVHVGA